MSRKQILTKKVAHTILAMSIVSAGGLNLWAGTAWAAANGNNGADDIRENVSISDSVDISVAGGNGTDGTAGSGTDDAGGTGGNGGAASFSGTLTVNDTGKAVSVKVQGAKGSNGGDQTAQSDVITGTGGSGGDAELQLTVGSNVQTGALTLAAEAGNGGKSGSDTSGTAPTSEVTLGNGGAGGNAAAGIAITDGSLTATSISLTIKAGDAGNNGYISKEGKDNHGGDGGTAGTAAMRGIVLSGQQAAVKVTNDIIISGTGGRGGAGGSTYGEAGLAAVGGAAEAYGLVAAGSGVYSVSFANLTLTATGGDGGYGGTAQTFQADTNNSHGDRYKSNDGAAGGSAAGVGLTIQNGSMQLTAEAISSTAAGGAGGAGGSKGSYGGSSGVDGSAGGQGAQAEAYGVYADSGSVITLSAKTNGGTITIGAKASNTETQKGSKAYAVYADNATVLFNDKAVLNSDGSSTDNDVITYLNNATFGFGSPGEGQNVGRTIDGGTLQLTGSNTFKVATDLSNVTPNADKFTFAKLAADSSTATQYITVGYDKAFDGSRLNSFIGDVTVLTVTDLEPGQNLNNFVGKESVMDDPLTRFLATPTVTVDGNDVKITQIDFEEAGASETVMTAADAQMAMGSMWRIEGNNLMKRMGELRSDKEAAKGGVWARYYRGELSADSAYDRSFSQDYTAFQGGIDKVQDYKGGKLYTGIAVNRIDSNAGYTAGSGDLSSTGVGVYASWLGSKGHYLDVIARGSKLTNDFKLVDSSNNAAKADYDTWAYGISAEYGYRQNLNAGWFVEPQAELSLGHIGSADYTMSNGGRIENDGVDSAVTRIGILGGKEFTIGGRPSNAYVKASLLHDFGGSGGATGYYGSDSLALQTGDLTGTWYEIGLGANLGIAKNSNLYFDALKTFGGDLRTDWQFNAGLRFTF